MYLIEKILPKLSILTDTALHLLKENNARIPNKQKHLHLTAKKNIKKINNT